MAVRNRLRENLEAGFRRTGLFHRAGWVVYVGGRVARQLITLGFWFRDKRHCGIFSQYKD